MFFHVCDVVVSAGIVSAPLYVWILICVYVYGSVDVEKCLCVSGL